MRAERFGSYSTVETFAGDVLLVPLEVDDAIQPLVSAAAPPRRDLAAVVAAAGPVQVLGQRPIRLVRRDLVERLHGLKPRAWRSRVVLANRHIGDPCRPQGPGLRTQQASGPWPRRLRLRAQASAGLSRQQSSSACLVLMRPAGTPAASRPRAASHRPSSSRIAGPTNRPCRFILPWASEVRTLSTFAPSSCSTAR